MTEHVNLRDKPEVLTKQCTKYELFACHVAFQCFFEYSEREIDGGTKEDMIKKKMESIEQVTKDTNLLKLYAVNLKKM